ncbi:hypothetical protein PITC_039650 [Penicillium italicum]|uniref:Uncharacterized protein n=1 Tax=Penicillium italicum TaxID=40296 RepID=A0A0A2L165_PENIT|nr:hypothetical protein PITC_039650 [Penicillium italicum]
MVKYEDPSILVMKYHEYLYGDSKGDHLAVLDGQRLPQILGAIDIRVVPQQDLLEGYLNTLQEQAAEECPHPLRCPAVSFCFAFLTHQVLIRMRTHVDKGKVTEH